MAKKAKAKKKVTKKKVSPKKKAKKPVPKSKSQKTLTKKKSAKKAASKKSGLPELSLPWRQPQPGEELVGVVDDYFSHLGVITLTLKTELQVGDQIHVRGHTTDITETVNSMQIEHKPVQEAAAGAGVGIKLGGKTRRGDYVYKVT